MARAAIVTVITSAGIVLASLAGQPPNLEKALEAQRQLIAQQPYEAQAHNDLGNLLLVAGQAAEAEQAYRRAVELDAENTAARFNLAIFLQQSGRAEEALSELRELLLVDAYHGWGHYQMGVLLEQQGDRTLALEHYARAFAYDPTLTFADNNPHIIDNRLSTEALLLSQRYRKPQAAGVPRLYSNPDRILDLMLGEPQAGGDEERAPAASQGPGSAEAHAGRPDAQLPSGTGDGGGADGGPGSGPDRAEDEEEQDDGEGGGAPRRVLTPANIGGGSRNQATAGAAAPGSSPRQDSREEQRRAFEERFKAARERARSLQPSAGSAGSAAPSAGRPPASTGVTRRPRYIPGRASTGRLELELRTSPPAPPEERHADLGGSAPAAQLDAVDEGGGRAHQPAGRG